MIYHPSSPFGGKHVTSPVELIDIYPTLMDLNGMPRPDAYKHNCFVPSRPRACVRLDGESLAPSVLGVPAPTGHRFLSTGACKGHLLFLNRLLLFVSVI